MKSIADIRHDYGKLKLEESQAGDNPFLLFKKWFEMAVETGFKDPNAMVLSTVSQNCRPSSRVVLLKGFDENGFVFYTNYDSRKGKQLEENNFASILFFWDILERQVRIEGRVEKVTREESETYFNSRPYQSRIGARASKQSQILKSRAELVKNATLEATKHPFKVPLPENWGGYKLVPDYFEFWQGRESRMHDRLVYDRFSVEANTWQIKRLYP